MQFSIRSNDTHPDWPTKPDPKDLAAALSAAKDGKAKKAAPAVALAATRARVAAGVRHGCQSDNLDWLAMVTHLRATIQSCWVDGSCPSIPPEGIKVETFVRAGEVWNPEWASNTHQYHYVSFKTLEKPDEA